MTDVHTDRTSFFHVLKVPTKTKTRCVKILGSSSLFRRHQESFVTAEANGRRSLLISISSCRFTSTPLYVPLLSPQAQTSRLDPFWMAPSLVTQSFLSVTTSCLCFWITWCSAPFSHWPLPYQGLPPPAFVVYHVCGINLLWVSCRTLIFHSNDSIVMIFLVYSEWLQALK